MKRYFIYFIVYSIGGFLLERVINFIAFYESIVRFDSIIDYIIYYDNSVLFGPYQPLYGLGVVLAILIYDKVLINVVNPLKRNILFLAVAILTTAFSEAFHGYGYQFLTGTVLWDYRAFFPCSIPYVCIYPTTLFGIGSFFIIKYVHPTIKQWMDVIPKFVTLSIIIVFSIDLLITLLFIL